MYIWPVLTDSRRVWLEGMSFVQMEFFFSPLCLREFYELTIRDTNTQKRSESSLLPLMSL